MKRLLLLVPAALLLDPIAAQDCARCAYRVPDTAFALGSSSQELPILVTNTGVDIFALQLAFKFDVSKLTVTEVSRDGTVAAGADFFEGAIDAGRGLAAFGVLWDVGGDFTSKLLPAGENRTLVVLRIDVHANAATTTSLSFEAVQIDSVSAEPTHNVMTNPQGESIAPAIESGTITIEDRTPQITAIVDNAGPAGHVFRIEGRHFAEPDLLVTVDGVAAEAAVNAGGTAIDVTAPPSEKSGCVPVIVTTVRGFASEPAGFCYREAGGVFIRADGNGDGRLNLADGQYVLNYLFLGGPDARCRDAMDANDSGGVEIADGVYVFNHLFLGGPPPRAPFPEAGTDPTADALPECVE